MEEYNLPELNIKITSIEVKGGKTIKLTVNNTFNVGFKGKILTFIHWLFNVKNLSYKEYLKQPIKYTRELDNLNYYHSIDCEKELEEMLKSQIKNNK